MLEKTLLVFQFISVVHSGVEIRDLCKFNLQNDVLARSMVFSSSTYFGHIV